MMFKKRSNVSVIFTDQTIGFFQQTPFLEQAAFGTINLERGAIDNGYIKEPESVLKSLGELFKKYHIVPRKITFLIHDQNILIRDVKIDPKELGKKSIDQYLQEQMGKTLHFPYPNPVITHFVREQDDNLIRVIAIIADGLLLHGYHDIFDRIKAKEVQYEIAAIPLYNVYHNKVSNIDDNVMFVNVYQDMFSIQILEKGFPIFNLIEETDAGKEEFALNIENFVDRISNYYKFNLRKGKQNITKVLVFNMSEDFSQEELQNMLIKRLKSHSAQLCDFNIDETFSKLLPKQCKLPYAAFLGEPYRVQHTIDFKLNRRSMNQVYGHYLMVISFAIAVFTVLVYVPYYAMNEEIKMQQNRNNALEMQRDLLILETPQTPNYPINQINHHESYYTIIDERDFVSGYIRDIFAALPPSITITNYQIRTLNNEIVIIITASKQQLLYEFVLDLYEHYGVQGESDDTYWMIVRPTYRIISPTTMEVTINYA